MLFRSEAVSPTSGRIEIDCHTTAAGTEIHVADNGPGISPEIVDRLFEPFVSHGKEKGIGLGLTVVQNVMRQHGGEVSIVRTGPTGTVVRLVFPPAAENLT